MPYPATAPRPPWRVYFYFGHAHRSVGTQQMLCVLIVRGDLFFVVLPPCSSSCCALDTGQAEGVADRTQGILIHGPLLFFQCHPWPSETLMRTFLARTAGASHDQIGTVELEIVSMFLG